jgi:hypothetical protein
MSQLVPTVGIARSGRQGSVYRRSENYTERVNALRV